MTHDELLANIHAKGNSPFETIKYDLNGQKNIQLVFKALREVVELHKPVENEYIKSGFICAGCKDRCGCYEGDMLKINDWETCPTIETVMRELNGYS